MRTVEVQETATARDLLDQVEDGPVLLREQSGRTYVLVEVDPDDAATLTLAENARLNQILDRSRDRARREGWLSTQQVRHELDIE
ncbi:MAG: hypothetical protein ACLQNE_18960 [Thermoguttaceae bacterium]